MAMRRAAEMAMKTPRGIISRSVFSSTFNPPPNPNAPVKTPAEPNTNLFISGLNKRTTSETLRNKFAEFGEVLSARVVTDPISKYSKGFGFVRYATLEDAEKGIKGMDGQFLEGWVIFAEYSRPREPRENRDVPRPWSPRY